jgi:uncharacterized protein YegL
MKAKVFNLIILDESGSMNSIKKQALDGVNETIQTIRAAQDKHEDQEHYVTIVSFNSLSLRTIYDNQHIDNVKDLNDDKYYPNCSTPLYDAMGASLSKLEKSTTTDDVVLVTIITDGYENASREYDHPAIKSLVERLKAQGWVFTYIGANQDVEKVAVAISIDNFLGFSATKEGTEEMFKKESKARSAFFDKVSCMGFSCSKSDLQKDYFEE